MLLETDTIDVRLEKILLLESELDVLKVKKIRSRLKTNGKNPENII